MTPEEQSQQYHTSNARGYQPTLPQPAAKNNNFQQASQFDPTGGFGNTGWLTGKGYQAQLEALSKPGMASLENQPAAKMYGITQDTLDQYGAYKGTQGDEGKQAKAQNRLTPPENPAEALRYQFYGAQDAEAQNREMLQQAMNAYGEARQESSAAHQEAQARNEQLMREGLQQRMQEQENIRQQNIQMMQQRQATLQHMFGLLRQGGQGSLASFMSPLGSEMGQSYQMGMQQGQDYGSYYGNMMGTPDPSSQYTGQMGNVMANTQFGTPDYSAWMDPESMRSSWYLQPQTTVQQSVPTGPGGGAPQTSFNAPVPQQPQQMLYDWQRNPQEWADAINRYLG